jgi:hypothetical protein
MKLLALLPFLLLLIAISILSSSFSLALNYASLVIDNNQKIIDPEISPCNTSITTRLHFENGMTESRDRLPNVPALQLVSSGYSTAADVALQSAECFLYRSGWTCFGSFVSTVGLAPVYYISNTLVSSMGCNAKGDSKLLVGSSYLQYSIYTRSADSKCLPLSTELRLNSHQHLLSTRNDERSRQNRQHRNHDMSWQLSRRFDGCLCKLPSSKSSVRIL